MHDTSFKQIEKMEEFRRWCYGIASTGPKHLREKAREFINWIDEAIGEE